MKGSHDIGRRLALCSLVGLCLMLPEAAHAAEEAAVEYMPQTYGNTLWTLLGGILVMFMQAGFALVECGLTRAKNAGNIIMKNLLDFAMGAPLFFAVGFGLMFGSSSGGLFGSSLFFLGGGDASTPDGMWNLTFWFFQAMFCATAATIVSGSIAERTKFSSYLLCSALVSAVIYPISGHWAWNSLLSGNAGGWLGNMGFIDFAGSSVVHSVGGWIALAGAIVVGPRIGKYDKNGVARAIPGHNLPMAATGVFILWFAWFGFNCASTNIADGTIGYIAVNTCLAACTGTLGAMFTIWAKTGKPDPSMTLNGCLAGLVAITAGCFEVSPVGSLIIGFMAGIIVVFSVLFIDQKLKIDDPVGAVSVHGVCGAFGTLMVGLFAAPGYGTTTGLLYGGDINVLLVQALGVAVFFAWAFGMGYIMFKLISVVFGMRVSPEEEMKGLDITEHKADAYSGFQIFSNE